MTLLGCASLTLMACEDQKADAPAASDTASGQSPVTKTPAPAKSASTDEADADPDVIVLGGAPGIPVGMAWESFKAAYPDAKREDPLEGDDPNDCAYASSAKLPGLAFMLLDNKIARIDIQGGSRKTDRGVGIGSTEDAVKAAYGADLTVEPHPYISPKGQHLIVRPNGAANGILFETHHKRVIAYRVGLWDAVQYAEGCA